MSSPRSSLCMKDLGRISRGRDRRKGQDVQARSTAQWVGCDQNKRCRSGRVKDSWLWAEGSVLATLGGPWVPD